MSLTSLYCICLDRIYGYLKEGTWKFCTTNPFSQLPAREVNRLAEIALLYDLKDPERIGDFCSLLTSGRLTRIDLGPFFPKEEHCFLRYFQNSIALFKRVPQEAEFHFVRNIISMNPYLEELHLGTNPGVDVIQKCEYIQILKIYSFSPSSLHNTVPLDLSVLSSLRNLKVLYISNMDAENIANILETCPNLISIGLNDSLDSLEEIAKRRQKNSLLSFDVGKHFQLRRCVWGTRFLIDDSLGDDSLGYFKFYNKMRFAVALCPFVQELDFHVYTKDALKTVTFLKHLTFLKINFMDFDDEILQDSVELLLEIGQQLKHLSLSSSFHCYPVDVICDCCPHLQSLEISGFMFLKNSLESPRNLSLERLRFRTFYGGDANNRESLLYLLSNCKLLEELFLCEVKFFDDALLSEIFKMNPLTELKVTCIEDCELTIEGYKMLLEKAASIETVLISFRDRENFVYEGKSLFKDANLRYLKDVGVKQKEFFRCRLHEKRF